MNRPSFSNTNTMGVVKLFTLAILLIISGDVELNPGPKPVLMKQFTRVHAPDKPGEDTFITDQSSDAEIRRCSRVMSMGDWKSIGKELGFTERELSEYRRKYPRLEDSFFHMFRWWRDHPPVGRSFKKSPAEIPGITPKDDDEDDPNTRKLTVTIKNRKIIKNDKDQRDRAAQFREVETEKRMTYRFPKEPRPQQQLPVPVPMPMPELKPTYQACKCGRLHADCAPKDVVDVWNRYLRDSRKTHETNMRIVLFAPLLYNRSTLAPRWQSWMKSQDLIVDDSASQEKKREIFARLDDLDKIFECIITELSTVKPADFQAMSKMLEEVEKATDFSSVLRFTKGNSFFNKMFDILKKKKKIAEDKLTKLLTLMTFKQYWLYVHHTVVHKKEILTALMKLSEKDEKLMNSLKDKGNNLYKNSKYREAHSMYTKALSIGVFNHILYSNRCQASRQMEDYWDALWDARRAITIKPSFEKGHYRYAQSFYELKDLERAMKENKRGQKMCKDMSVSISDLDKQFKSYEDEWNKQILARKTADVPDLVSEDSNSDSDVSTEKPEKLGDQRKSTDIARALQKEKQAWEQEARKKEEKKKEEFEKRRQEIEKRRQEIFMQRDIERKMAEDAVLAEYGRRQREDEERRRRAVERNQEMIRIRNAEIQRMEEERAKKEEQAKEVAHRKEEKKRQKKEKARQKKRREEEERERKEEERRRNEEERARLKKQREEEEEIKRKEKEAEERFRLEQAAKRGQQTELERCLEEGSLALIDDKPRPAITLYEKGASLMKITGKEYGGMYEQDYIIFLYAHAVAHMRSGVAQEINEAVNRFRAITEDFPSLRNPLPYYGLAQGLYKLNRFSEALDPLEKSQFMLDHFEMPTMTWPGTFNATIPETEKGKLQEALNELQQWCKMPPNPDAVCRYELCPAKREMYLSDLDFKGYIKTQCSERCYLDYHITCWKTRKSDLLISSDRDALTTNCTTPDCDGVIACITIVGANGLIKTEVKLEKPKQVKEESKPKSHGKHRKDKQKDKKKKGHQTSEGAASKVEKGQGDAPDKAPEKMAAAKKDDVVKQHVITKPRTASDAGSTRSTESLVKESGQNEEEKQEGQKDGEDGEEEVEEEVEMKPAASFMLKRDDFPEDDSVVKKKTKSKKKIKKFLAEEDASKFLDIAFTERGGVHQRYGADYEPEDYEAASNRPWQPTLAMSSDRPFAIPSHLAQAAIDLDLERPFKTASKIVLPETDEEKSQKMVLSMHFSDILGTHGPLELDNPILQESLSFLDIEHQDLVLNRGGLKAFLIESPDFVVMGNYASLKRDHQRCTDLAFPDGFPDSFRSEASTSLSSSLMPTASGISRMDAIDPIPPLNPTAPEFVPKKFSSPPDPMSTSLNVDLSHLESRGNSKHTSSSFQFYDFTEDSSVMDGDEEDNDYDDSEEEDDDSEDDSSSSEEDQDFHDAASDLQEPLKSELDQLTSDNLNSFKADGIDDEDYHWQDHFDTSENSHDSIENDLDNDDADDEGDGEDEDNDDEMSEGDVDRHNRDYKEDKVFKDGDDPAKAQSSSVMYIGYGPDMATASNESKIVSTSQASADLSSDKELDKHTAEGDIVTSVSITSSAPSEASIPSEVGTSSVGVNKETVSDAISVENSVPKRNEGAVVDSSLFSPASELKLSEDNNQVIDNNGVMPSDPYPSLGEASLSKDNVVSSSDSSKLNPLPDSNCEIPDIEHANSSLDLSSDSKPVSAQESSRNDGEQHADSQSEGSDNPSSECSAVTDGEGGSQTNNNNDIVGGKDDVCESDQDNEGSSVDGPLNTGPPTENDDSANVHVSVTSDHTASETETASGAETDAATSAVPETQTETETRTETETVSPIETDAAMSAVPETQTETETASGSEANAAMSAVPETETETETASGTETDAETSAVPETQTETETASGTETDAATSAVPETQTETETALCTETDAATSAVPETQTETETALCTKTDAATSGVPETLTETQTDNRKATEADNNEAVMPSKLDASLAESEEPATDEKAESGHEDQLEKQEPQPMTEDNGVQNEQHSESFWQEQYEHKLQEWKKQNPSSPVREVKTVGVNTKASAWKLEAEYKELQKNLSETFTAYAMAQMKIKEDRENFEHRLDVHNKALKTAYDEKVRALDREKDKMERSRAYLSEEFQKRRKKYDGFEEKEKLFAAQEKQFEQLKKKHEQLTQSSTKERDSLRSEIALLRDSIKTKDKVNKTLDSQTKKLMSDKLELEERVERLVRELATATDERLMAEARRSQMELRMKEALKRPQELTQLNQDLEKQLGEQEVQSTRLMERACKAEIQFLQLFCSREMKPLEDVCNEAEHHINTITNIVQNNPTMEEHVREIRHLWQDCLNTNRKVMEESKEKFKQQEEQIRKGALLDSLTPVEIPAPYKPEGLAQGGNFGSSNPQQTFTGQPSGNQRGMPTFGSWLMPGSNQSELDLGEPEAAAAIRPKAMENPPMTQPQSVAEAQRNAHALAQAEIRTQAQAQAQYQQAQFQDQVHALADQLRALSQAQGQYHVTEALAAESRAQTPPSQAYSGVGLPLSSRDGFLQQQQQSSIPSLAPQTLNRAPGSSVTMPAMQGMGMQLNGQRFQQGLMQQTTMPQQQPIMAPRQQQQLTAQQQHQFMAARQQHLQQRQMQQQQQQQARPKNSFERIMQKLHVMFPNYNKVQLTNFLKSVRSENKGSLSGLSVEEILRRVNELVRERQVDSSGMAPRMQLQNKGMMQSTLARSQQPPPGFSSQLKTSTTYQPAPTPTQSAWGGAAKAATSLTSNWHKELVDGEEEEDDPCVICHDEMSGDNVQELPCGHIFHALCIHEWLNQQKTCPTCRNYTVLDADYPGL